MEVILNGIDRRTERDPSRYEWIIVRSSSPVDWVIYSFIVGLESS